MLSQTGDGFYLKIIAALKAQSLCDIANIQQMVHEDPADFTTEHSKLFFSSKQDTHPVLAKSEALAALSFHV